MRRLFSFLVCCVLGAVLWAAPTVRVGVLLPLKDRTSRGTVMVEFYRGLLMAVEAAKGEGVNVDCYAYDSGTTEVQMRELLTKPELVQLDVVFGPLEGSQVNALAAFCYSHKIRMVLPFNTPCPHVYSNPWIYQVGVAQELLYPNVTSLVMEHLGNAQFIFYYSGEKDERAASFAGHLRQVLELRDVPTVPLAAGGDEFAFDRAFNQFRQNVVVIDSRSQASLNQMLAKLKDYVAGHPQYKIALLGYPEWLTYSAASARDFHRFDTYVFSTYFRDALSGRTIKFEQQYLRNFAQPSRQSYPKAEMLGYDLGCYFIMGIGEQGKNFDVRQSVQEQKPLQHGFSFQRVGEQGGYVNTFVQLVHYLTNNTIQLLK